VKKLDIFGHSAVPLVLAILALAPVAGFGAFAALVGAENAWLARQRDASSGLENTVTDPATPLRHQELSTE
jgi:hypothetical protein